MPVLNVAAYKFVELDDLESRRRLLRRRCHELGLRGTILLATEGINFFVAGERPGIEGLIEFLQNETGVGPLETKESFTEYQPFTRMLVKIKREIIAFGVEGISPARYTSKRIAPVELKQWLDEGRPVTLLDTRNDYEVDLGTFEGAVRLSIDHFRDFPRAAEALPVAMREQPVVTFCTGGIRCEKAAPALEQMGFRDVYQLDGGILKYFEQVGGAHYRGDCFVFDQRVAVDAALRETDAAQCYACQAILSPEDQQSPHYVKGESCPRCYRTTVEAMQESIAKRHEAIRRVTTPLPGSVAYDRRLPLHVAGEWGGLAMLEFLPRAVPSLSREYWQDEIELGRVLMDDLPVSAERTVVAGEKYEHLVPQVVEPAVNVDIRILYEDADLVVIDKPAPLPIHVGGRYEKNTLSAILAPVYAPERVRHAHRLDANTTGVVVLARTRRIAKLLRTQFEGQGVKKEYLARVAGHPTGYEFTCTASIAREASTAGTRELDDDGLAAETRFRVLARSDDGTKLLAVEPITGRTNQIRLHLASLGFPIVGDPSYNADSNAPVRQTLDIDEAPMCLHAWRLTIVHPSSRQSMTFEAPAPLWAQ
jgi:UPF0176 protein